MFVASAKLNVNPHQEKAKEFGDKDKVNTIMYFARYITTTSTYTKFKHKITDYIL